jgi:hypothetical protein
MAAEANLGKRKQLRGYDGAPSLDGSGGIIVDAADGLFDFLVVTKRFFHEGVLAELPRRTPRAVGTVG